MDDASISLTKFLSTAGVCSRRGAEPLISAGLILSNKNRDKVRNYRQWNRHFQIFGLLPVLLLTAVVVLTLGSFVDYYLYF